jgi:hypothetical protein
MNPDTRDMTLTEKADAAFKQAAAKVIERARQTGTPVILWENGRIVKRSWEELINEPTETPDQTHERITEIDRENAAGQAHGETAHERAGNHETPR